MTQIPCFTCNLCIPYGDFGSHGGRMNFKWICSHFVCVKVWSKWHRSHASLTFTIYAHPTKILKVTEGGWISNGFAHSPVSQRGIKIFNRLTRLSTDTRFHALPVIYKHLLEESEKLFHRGIKIFKQISSQSKCIYPLYNILVTFKTEGVRLVLGRAQWADPEKIHPPSVENYSKLSTVSVSISNFEIWSLVEMS